MTLRGNAWLVYHHVSTGKSLREKRTSCSARKHHAYASKQLINFEDKVST